ncbi:hypothetical protein QE152_g21758 [Popillia japonica]|uniref:Uncharacterized protein n=1 Tax=Popillia japonica TaxID=7064 RepID=A0AAW1KL38_POPJA
MSSYEKDQERLTKMENCLREIDKEDNVQYDDEGEIGERDELKIQVNDTGTNVLLKCNKAPALFCPENKLFEKVSLWLSQQVESYLISEILDHWK